MLDLYGSYTPHTLHTHPPSCPPTAQPRTASLSSVELASLLVPSAILLLVLTVLVKVSTVRPNPVHIYYKAPPPPPPTPTFNPQAIYNIQAWGGEETPIIWAADYYPQLRYTTTTPKSDETPQLTPSKDD